MDVGTIKNFIKFLKESRYNEFSMKDGGVSLRIRFEREAAEKASAPGIDSVSPRHAEKAVAASAEGVKEKTASANEKIITAPIVGRFYSTMTAENLEPIRRGDPVRKNQKICMIEAMNIEHEISSPYAGVMTEMFVDDGAAVMFGQPLFKIRAN